MSKYFDVLKGSTYIKYALDRGSSAINSLFRQMPGCKVVTGILCLGYAVLLIPGMSFAWSNVPKLYSPKKVTSDNATLTGFPKYVAQGQQTMASTKDVIDAMYGTADNHSPAFDFLMHYDSSGTGYVPNSMPPGTPLSFRNTLSTISTAAYLQGKQSSQCLPMMTVYTANSSGGFGQITSVVKNAQCCALNLACLGAIAYLIHNGYGDDYAQQFNNPISGLIVLNPDLLAADILISKGYTAIGSIEVNRIMALLDHMFNEYKAKYAVGKEWYPEEKIIYSPEDTVLNVIDWIYASDLNCKPYNRAQTVAKVIETAFLACASKYKQKLDENTGKLVPTVLDTISFTDDFPGWILANNYMVNKYGPSVAFAWDYGVYQYGYTDGIEWIHENVSDAVALVDKTVDYYKEHLKSSLFNPICSSDFIASDIANYNPMQSTANFDAGWLFNQTSWNLWFYYLERLSAALNSVPVLPYQVSGGGLPPVSVSLPTEIIGQSNTCNTLANYIFGNFGQSDVSIPSDFDTVTLGHNYKHYSDYNLKAYLLSNIDITTTNEHTADWNKPHPNTVYRSGICGISWGGSASSDQLPGLSPFFPQSPGGRLSEAVKAYRETTAPFPEGAYGYDTMPAQR